MIYFLFLIIPSWYLFHIFEYGLHKLSHSRKYGGYIYKIHMNHHKKYYPLSKFTDYEPYKTGKTLIFTDGLKAFSLPSTIIIYTMYCVLDYLTFSYMLIQVLFFFYISDLLHTHIHMKDSPLEKYKWFIELRKKHLIHHKYYLKNLNIIDPLFDNLSSR